jgi:type IV secretory pathway VirB4 component
MKIQIKEYIEFIKTFTSNTNIMTKSFYLIIPYTPATLSVGKMNFLGKKEKITKEKATAQDFEENRSQLQQRISIVEQGITRTGVRSVRLGTEEVIEIFYKLFNPGDVEKPIPLE